MIKHNQQCMCRYCIQERQDKRIRNIQNVINRPLTPNEVNTANEYSNKLQAIAAIEKPRPKVRYPWTPYPCVRGGRLVRLNDDMEIIGEQ